MSTATQTAGILIVDDEPSVRDSLSAWFRKDGYRIGAAEDAPAALRLLQSESWDAVLLDIKMPGMDGMELQRRIHEIDPTLAVIMVTAYASVETAVQALKQGAFDYITKPIDPDELSHLVQKALDHRHLQAENVQLREKVEELSRLDEIVGESPEIRRVLALVDTVAQTDATVLIRGESGTGKELIARAIHAKSARRYFPIVPVHCGALAEGLLESELFGHEKGAFTGAQYRRKGKLELADGGTLFLDEIGTISLKTQVELLRALETKEFVRLGGSRTVRVDFRVICATNLDLEKAVASGAFREDFYYRVNVFTLSLPPLRERVSDIPALAEHFRRKYAQQMDRAITAISPEAMDLLVRHSWPGNIRELANAVERAMVVGKPPMIQPEDLPFPLVEGGTGLNGDTLEDIEHAHVVRVLERTHWNVTRAAEILDVDRVTLYNKIKKYGLRRT
jgi:DNA-binding NtrC family response regulator